MAKNNLIDTINLEKIFNNILKNWLIYAICLFLSFAVAVYKNKTSPKVYKVGTYIILQDEERNSYMNPAQLFRGFGMFSGEKNFENEIIIIKSTTVIKNAIKNLDFRVSYFEKNRFGKNEYYKNSPFIVTFDENHPQPANLKIYVRFLNNSRILVSAEGEKVQMYSYAEDKVLYDAERIKLNKEYSIGDLIENEYYKFKIINNIKASELVGKEFYFYFNNIYHLVYIYKNGLEIYPYSERSTVAVITLEGANPNKIIDFLNSLTEEYLKKNLERKNHIAQSTVEYISSQLKEIVDTLNYTEVKLQEFRARNRVISVSDKATRIHDQLQNLESEKAQILIKYKYYKYIDDYFQENKDLADLLAPSAMGIDDPLLNNLIIELTNLTNEKNSLLTNNQQKSPYLKQLSIKIENLKNNIYENIKFILNTTQISLDDINSRISKLNNEVAQLPKTERELFGIEREFKLNNEIYTFLLQKKAEAEITEASNLPDSEIIEQARLMSDGPISPKKKRNYILALFAGFIIPLFITRLIKIIDNRISNIDEVKDSVDLPILGTIPHIRKISIPFKFDPQSITTELFRKIRTNLEFYSTNDTCQVILITSTLGNEGKTFNAINLAGVFAMLGRKTLLIGFDLRKPNVHKFLGHENTIGVSSYLINKANFDDIIIKDEIEGLDIITSGEIPPNPSELIASDKTKELFEKLGEQYEYIIIDSPPIGIVPDTYSLFKYATANLYVIRQHHTLKRHLLRTIDEIKEKNIAHLGILFNDEKVERRDYKYKYKYYK